MNIKIRILLLCLCFISARLFAGTGADDSTNTTQTDAGESQRTFPFEFDAEYTYIGKSDVERSFRRNNDIQENYSLLRFIYTPRIKFGILRLGAAWERFSFTGLDPFIVEAGGDAAKLSGFRFPAS